MKISLIELKYNTSYKSNTYTELQLYKTYIRIDKLSSAHTVNIEEYNRKNCGIVSTTSHTFQNYIRK